MAPPTPPSMLTLIVATTPSLGIGARGALPWPLLPGEMAHFKRCTLRSTANPSAAPSGARNAVIMGRHTWSSIPARFRPLPGRANIVVTRDAASLSVADGADATATAVGSLDAAVALAARAAPGGEVFVIGGARMYAAALGMAACGRVLLTRIAREFECDVFFPLDMEGEEARRRGWQRRDVRGAGWVEGEARREEKGVEYEFCLYERDVTAAAPAEGDS